MAAHNLAHALLILRGPLRGRLRMRMQSKDCATPRPHSEMQCAQRPTRLLILRCEAKPSLEGGEAGLLRARLTHRGQSS
jgi:hypothetical protein